MLEYSVAKNVLHCKISSFLLANFLVTSSLLPRTLYCLKTEMLKCQPENAHNILTMSRTFLD